MELYIRVTILPMWKTPASDPREAQERGELRVKFLELAQEFEAKIKAVVEARNGV